LNIAAEIACLAALVLRINKGGRFQGSARWPYFVLVVVSTLPVLTASHYGGKWCTAKIFYRFNPGQLTGLSCLNIIFCKGILS